MKKLFKIIGIILFSILSVNIQAEGIHECKSDLYYANGIMMGDKEPKALKKWKKEALKIMLANPGISEKIANVRISYNESQGFLDDLLEAFEQVMSNEWGWKAFSLYFSTYLTDKGIQEDWVPHIKDLVKQVNSYKESIKLGHSVVVIAHSQGNYYTNEAYELLDDWMKAYFKMMGVATPANYVAGFEAGDTTAPYVKFHNDFIKVIATGLSSNRDDPNPNHNGIFSIAAHDFYDSYLTAENTKGEILGFIETKVEEHTTTPSQWETNEEFELDTCDYKITVKHRHDPDNIIMDNMVYPFAANKKLYQVNGEWVKASCGGENILADWDGKKDEECWMIDNPQEEKIARSCGVPSSEFEIIAHHGWKTKYWWVTIKIIETNEIIDYVTPFNLTGSLYRVKFDRGRDGHRWVIASCGGTEIFEDWEGKKDHEEWMINNPQEEKTVGRYIRDNEKEIVINTVQDTMWQDNSEVTTIFKPWITIDNVEAGRYWDTSGDTASTYCENLIWGGYSDWRLPNAASLHGFYGFLYGKDEVSVLKNFIVDSNCWTSRTYEFDYYRALAYHYRSPNNTHFDKSDNYNIRCMRGDDLDWRGDGLDW